MDSDPSGVRGQGLQGLERLNSHEESPSSLSCDFCLNGIRELCTLQSSSSENIGNTKLLWTAAARCDMFLWTDFRQRDSEGRGGGGLLGLK